MQARTIQTATPPAPPRFDPSLRCFFNALLRETRHWRLETRGGRTAFALDLPGGAVLRVPCDHVSTTGRHAVTGPCELVRDGRPTTVGFAEAVRWALETLPTNAREVQQVLARAVDSRHNMEEALSARADDLDRLFAGPLDFIEAEAALLVGHSVHPCPKARDRFTRDDARAYAPEFRGRFRLQWLAVDARHVRQSASAGHGHTRMVRDLADHDATLAAWLAEADDGTWLLPCHPFQLDHWLALPAVARLVEAGAARVLGESDLLWRATSSLRAVHCPDAPWMLKFSLTVKLTNSVRHLQPEELVRGALLADLLDTPEGRAFQARFPELTVLPEPVSVALTDGGDLLPETGLLWRANPFRGAAAEGTEVLATLLQDDPRDGVPRLVQRLRAAGAGDRDGATRWFDRFLHVVVRPLLLAQADHGILFGAHQQNIVVALDGVWPRHAYFRDCQGTGFSALARRMPRMERLERDGALVVDGDGTTVLFTYYLFVNAAFNAVSSLAMSGWVTEAELVGRLRRFLEGLLEDGVEDDSVIRHLLTAPELRIKGNLHCTLSALNENTQSDILALYRPIPNPLRGA